MVQTSRDIEIFSRRPGPRPFLVPKQDCWCCHSASKAHPPSGRRKIVSVLSRPAAISVIRPGRCNPIRPSGNYGTDLRRPGFAGDLTDFCQHTHTQFVVVGPGTSGHPANECCRTALAGAQDRRCHRLRRAGYGESRPMDRLVSIIIPFFNEAGNIAALPEALWPVLETIPGIAWEVICTDDGSTDSTLAELVLLSQSDRRFRVLELTRHFGKEAALTAGLDAARGDAVIPMDADLQDPPEVIARMLAAWTAGCGGGAGAARRPQCRWHAETQIGKLVLPFPQPAFRDENPRKCRRFPADGPGGGGCAEALLPERQRFMKGLFAWVGFRTCHRSITSGRPAAPAKPNFPGSSFGNWRWKGLPVSAPRR